MAGKDEKEGEPRQGYIPRPPSPEDIDRVSGQQGLITDEWAGPTPARPQPGPEPEPERETEGQPS